MSSLWIFIGAVDVVEVLAASGQQKAQKTPTKREQHVKP